MSIPKELKYSNEHEWVRVNGDTLQIGITTFAVDQLGDVTQVDLPEVGDSVVKGEIFGTVESVKAVSDLFAPISGKVKSSNDPLNDSPEDVNESPYEKGWMIEITDFDAGDLASLMDSDAYATFLKEQDA